MEDSVGAVRSISQTHPGGFFSPTMKSSLRHFAGEKGRKEGEGLREGERGKEG